MHLGCCGEQDCLQQPDGLWHHEIGGYRNSQTGEFVSEDDAKQSIDEHYWLCRKQGSNNYSQPNNGPIRPVYAKEGGMCFFAPAIGF